MTTTADDIKKRGGKCEKVATDFWECTDKDGVLWWCSDSGKSCIKAPLKISGKLRCLVEDDNKDPVTSATVKSPGEIVEEGGRCTTVDEGIAICKAKDGSVWYCKKNDGCHKVFNKEQPNIKEPRRSVLDQITFFQVYPMAVLPNPDNSDQNIEIVYKKTKGKGSEGGNITICEVCITTIDPQGNRLTSCSPIPCPKGQIKGPVGPVIKS